MKHGLNLNAFVTAQCHYRTTENDLEIAESGMVLIIALCMSGALKLYLKTMNWLFNSTVRKSWFGTETHTADVCYSNRGTFTRETCLRFLMQWLCLKNKTVCDGVVEDEDRVHDHPVRQSETHEHAYSRIQLRWRLFEGIKPWTLPSLTSKYSGKVDFTYNDVVKISSDEDDVSVTYSVSGRLLTYKDATNDVDECFAYDPFDRVQSDSLTKKSYTGNNIMLKKGSCDDATEYIRAGTGVIAEKPGDDTVLISIDTFQSAIVSHSPAELNRLSFDPYRALIYVHAPGTKGKSGIEKLQCILSVVVPVSMCRSTGCFLPWILWRPSLEVVLIHICTAVHTQSTWSVRPLWSLQESDVERLVPTFLISLYYSWRRSLSKKGCPKWTPRNTEAGLRVSP